MARSTIQDQPPAAAGASFERQPPQDLEDTKPFSLLNALLEGVDGAVAYTPPPLAQPDEVTEFFLSAVEASSPTEEGARSDSNGNEPDAEEPAPPTESTHPSSSQVSEDSQASDEAAPSVTETKSTGNDLAPSDEAPQDVSKSGSSDDPKPLPLSFPKISVELPPPPLPPRPKSRRFPAATPPFAKLEGKKSPHAEPPPSTEKQPSKPSWPQRGFQGTPTDKGASDDKPASLDPINKAIRIFESLPTEPEDAQGTKQPETPTAKSDELSTLEAPEFKDPEPTPLSAEEITPEPAPTASPEGAATPTPEEDLAELDTVKIQLPRNRFAKPIPPELEPKPKPVVPKGLSGIVVKDLSPPEETLVPEPADAKAKLTPDPEAKLTPDPEAKLTPDPEAKLTPDTKAELQELEKPAQQETKAPETSPDIPQQVSRALPPVPVRRRRRRRVPLNPWTAKRSDPLQGPDGRRDRNEHINKTLSDLAKMLESSLLTPTPESAPADALTTKVELKKTFSNDQKAAPPRATSKLKPVPRALSKKDTDAALASTAARKPLFESSQQSAAPNFEITAPTTLVADGAPISPFTKVARGQIKDTPKPTAQQSPFTLAKHSKVVSQASGPSEEKVFASPFSKALKKRQESSAEEGAPKGQTPESPVGRSNAHPDQEAALAEGQLPAPTYSFATMGLPSAQGKVPSTVPTAPAPAPGQAPSTVEPAHPGPFAKAAPSTPQKAPTQESATDRARRPRPESNAWGVLTWILCLVCGIFFLIYLYEIYRTLRNPDRQVISPDQEEVFQGTPSATEALESLPSLTPETPVPDAVVPKSKLTEPTDVIAGFIGANTEAIRDQYLVEDKNLRALMAEHYAIFPMQKSKRRQIVDSGTFHDTGRYYVTVRAQWDDDSETDTVLIKDASDNYRFSWHAFEQSRNQLLRHYAETSWTGWTEFFVNIKPMDPTTLPAGTVLDNLYYRITVPEDPEFEAIGYVDGLSSIASEFKDRFPNNSSYQVYLDLMRGESFHEDPRPLFRITRLIRESWDATP